MVWLYVRKGRGNLLDSHVHILLNGSLTIIPLVLMLILLLLRAPQRRLRGCPLLLMHVLRGIKMQKGLGWILGKVLVIEGFSGHLLLLLFTQLSFWVVRDLVIGFETQSDS